MTDGRALQGRGTTGKPRMKIHLPATTSAGDTPVSNLRIRATTLGHDLDGVDAAISKGRELPISEIDHTAVVESVGDQDSSEDLTRVKDLSLIHI